MEKNAVLMAMLMVALVFALMVVPVQAQEGPVFYGGIEFPLGDVSFADGVVSFNPGTDTVSPYNNPQSAIGTPNGCGENAVALGHGGILTVTFTNNYLIDVEGDDLYVFECGWAVEPFKVDISKDGSSWINLGTVSGQPTSIDIHGKVAPGDKFSYVRLTDAGGGSHPYAGADITAVGAIGAEERPDSDGDGVPDDVDQCFGTPTGVPLDDFNDNTINHTLWVAHVTGSGPTVAETNQRVEITIPADSSGGEFGAGYRSICKLRGDFDIQVDYELLVWPSANGGRVGLSTGEGQGHVERVSFGGSSSDFPGKPREVYLTHFADGVHGITATSDLSGKLRLVRKGSMQTGYYFDSGSSNWIAIHSASITTADTPFSISAWSADYAFTDQEVKIAFDNLVVNQGEVICPGTTTPPPAWCDYFDSATLDPQWSWVREDPTPWSLVDHPGYLRITIQDAYYLYGGWHHNENTLLRPAPAGDFEVVTGVTINPTLNYQQAGLVVYQDADNYFRLTRCYCNGGKVEFLKEVGASVTSNKVDCDLTTTYLTISKQGSTYTGYWSADGSNWNQVYQYTDVHLSNLKVGLAAFHAAGNSEIPADFGFSCVVPTAAVPTPTPTPSPTPATLGEYECPQDAGEAYQQYIAAYQTYYLMAEGKEDTPEAQAAYEEYKAAKACYESRISGTEPSPTPTPAPTPTPSPTPTPTGSCNWTGSWQTNWGKMILSQTGNQVIGTYTHDAGQITGTVSGNTLTGTWAETPSYSPPNDAGDMQLTIAADCNSLTGVWRYGSSGDWSGDWTGTRTGA